MRFDVPFTRRAVLRSGALTAGLFLLARLRAIPAAAATDTAAPLRVLTPRDARILEAIGARMTYTADPQMPRFADTAALQTIDMALRPVPSDVARQLSWALLLFEYGPPVFLGKPSSFTGLSPQWQDAYLSGWADSRFATRRLAFQAFKNLSMLGYYSQDATWPAIHYQGPWAPKPRRVLPDV